MLLPVDEALKRVLIASRSSAIIQNPLEEADGMVLAEDMIAKRNQPPFTASAMDGYAVRHSDLSFDTPLTIVGEAAAGHRYEGVLGVREAVRIFTGAPLPHGADIILIQEDAKRDGDMITLSEMPSINDYVRPAGFDFEEGATLLKAGTLLDFRSLSLAASMNEPILPVYKRPIVGILSNGDELVRPGQTPSDDQILASNVYGVASLVRANGGVPVDLGIARDDTAEISRALDRACEAECDIITTLGGASVGDHDLVKQVFNERDVDLDFWKIAMRPGKPFMFGTWNRSERVNKHTMILGMPGNPVSSLVCSLLFLKPLLLKMQHRNPDYAVESAIIGAPLAQNSMRQGYLRCRVERRDGQLIAHAFDNQDSSLLSVLNQANALLIRPPHAPAAKTGDPCDIMWIADA